jgi:xylulokinase
LGTLLAAIDCGTTAIKAGVFDHEGGVRALVQRECPCDFGADGAVSQDPERLLEGVFSALREAVSRCGAPAGQVAALALTNQRATLVPVGHDGRPLGPALSWQDLRGARALEELKPVLGDQAYYSTTGLNLHPVFSLGKLAWLRAHEPGRFAAAAAFPLVHSFVLNALGVEGFVDDRSNASLTGLLDLRGGDWSQPVLEAAGLSRARLPRLVDSGTRVGVLSPRAAGLTGLVAGTPLVAGGGDQQCAGIGAGAVRPGVVEVTLGTAGVALGAVQQPALDPTRAVTCCVHAVPGMWELEGLQNSAGAALQWLTRLVHGEGEVPRELMEAAAQVPPGCGGVTFYPHLAGASAPHWNPHATALFLGLTHAADRPTLARAVLEGVTLETRSILEVFAGLGLHASQVRLTGGYGNLPLWRRVLADALGCPVALLANPQATLLGAACLAAAGVGLYPGVPQAADRMVRTTDVLEPDPAGVAAYQPVYAAYCGTYRALRDAGLFRAERAG